MITCIYMQLSLDFVNRLQPSEAVVALPMDRLAEDDDTAEELPDISQTNQVIT